MLVLAVRERRPPRLPLFILIAGLTGLALGGCGPRLIGSILNASNLTLGGAGGEGAGSGAATVAPSGLTYSQPVAGYAVTPSVLTAIPSNVPTLAAGNGPITYSISPALPAGLSISPTTGVISGTPSANSAGAPAYITYTVTAANSAGSTTATLQLMTMTGYVVNDTGSGGDLDTNTPVCLAASGGCTLAAALDQANHTGGQLVISVKAGTYTPATAAGFVADRTQVGRLADLTDLVISGDGRATTILDGGGTKQGLYVNNQPNITVANLTVQNTFSNTGSSSQFYAAVMTLVNVRFYNNNSQGQSGGAFNLGSNTTSTIDRCVFESNLTAAAGGAIDADGHLTVTNSVFKNNTANYGGALNSSNGYAITIDASVFIGNQAVSTSGGALTLLPTNGGTINNCLFQNNSAVDTGGALLIDAPGTTAAHAITITRSVFTGNTAHQGGAIFNNRSGVSPMTHVTIVGNNATTGAAASRQGGGIYVAANGRMNITYSTIARNTANNSGSGIRNLGIMNLSKSIVAENTTANCSIAGTFNSLGYNFADTAGGACGTTVGTDFNAAATGLDAALAANGAPALDTAGSAAYSLALQAGSAAIDAIPAGTCAAVVDQRGSVRPSGAGCDVGAYER